MINLPQYLKLAHVTYDGMSQQQRDGIGFDLPKATSCLEELGGIIGRIKGDLEPQLPMREPLKGELKKMLPPKLQFKKDGTPSAACRKWFDEVSIGDCGVGWEGLKGDQWYKLPHHDTIKTRVHMTLSNNTQIKEWLMQQGWEPTMWNYKKEKGKYGKMEFVRKGGHLVKTSPKIQELGKVCPNLEAIADRIGLVKEYLKYLTYSHRKSQIEGWVKHPRIEIDGRLPAGHSGLTNTHRQRHNCVVNIPKVGSIYGKEMRSLFIPAEGKVFVGYDAAGLEARMEAHFTAKHDGGVYAKELLEGDIHCYSSDTEILTESGWRIFGDLTPGEKVAQFDKGVITFIKPLEIIKGSMNGGMRLFEGRHISALVTPNHKMVLSPYPGAMEEKYRADALSMTNGSSRFLTAGLHDGNSEISKDFLSLLIAIQADGSFEGGRVRMEFRKERKKNRIKCLLLKNKIPFSECNTRKGGTRFAFKNTFIEFLGGDKNFDWSLINLPLELKRHFLKEVCLWDGWISRGLRFYQQSGNRRASVEVVQTIAALAGNKTTISSIDPNSPNSEMISRVTFREHVNGERGVMAVKRTEIDYKGEIWCVTVPSGTIITKRMGKILVCGNSKNSQIFYPEETGGVDINAPDFNKDDESFKPYRDKSKNGKYALTYGAQPNRLAITLGINAGVAKMLFDNFWDNNPSLKAVKDEVTDYWRSVGGGRYIITLGGAKIYTRSEHSLVNALFQSAGGKVMDMSWAYMRSYLDKRGISYTRTAYMHDEYVIECREEDAEMVLQCGIESIKAAGKYFKLRVPLDADGKIGMSWGEVH